MSVLCLDKYFQLYEINWREAQPTYARLAEPQNLEDISQLRLNRQETNVEGVVVDVYRQVVSYSIASGKKLTERYAVKETFEVGTTLIPTSGQLFTQRLLEYDNQLWLAETGELDESRGKTRALSWHSELPPLAELRSVSFHPRQRYAQLYVAVTALFESGQVYEISWIRDQCWPRWLSTLTKPCSAARATAQIYLDGYHEISTIQPVSGRSTVLASLPLKEHVRDWDFWNGYLFYQHGSQLLGNDGQLLLDNVQSFEVLVGRETALVLVQLVDGQMLLKPSTGQQSLVPSGMMLRGSRA